MKSMHTYKMNETDSTGKVDLSGAVISSDCLHRRLCVELLAEVLGISQATMRRSLDEIRASPSFVLKTASSTHSVQTLSQYRYIPSLP